MNIVKMFRQKVNHTNKTIELFIVTFIFFFIYSCNKPDKIMILVDTSGSMKTEDRIGTVKKAVKDILEKNRNNDCHFYIAAFDVNVNEIYNGVPKTFQIDKLVSDIEELDAVGKWTYLDKALRYIKKQFNPESEERQVAYVFTDGINDVPPGVPEISFEELMNKNFDQTWNRSKSINLYIIDVTNTAVPQRGSIWQVIGYTGYLVKKILPWIIVIAVLVIAVIILIGKQNKIANNPKNIKSLARLADKFEDSPEELSVRINLNNNLFWKRKIDLGKKYPFLFQIGPAKLYIIVNRSEKREMFSKDRPINVGGYEYQPNEPWNITYDQVFIYDQKYFIIK